MQTRTLGQNEEGLPLLGFGCMRLPVDNAGNIDEAAAKEMVDAALAAGVNYFDTAYHYHDGESAKFLGRALRDIPRDRYLIADKLPTYMVDTLAGAQELLEEQLGRHQTDYIDFYLLHALDAERFAKMEALGVYEWLRRCQAEGKIRYLGFSFHGSPEELQTICATHEWDFAQIQLNYFDWIAYQSREQYEILRSAGIPIVVMEPLRGGWLADLGKEGNAILQAATPGKSVASWALRYVADLPGVVTVLSGMSDMAQMQDNIQSMETAAPLSEAERAALQKALQVFCQHAYIPCTGCRYCMPCPSGVDIPSLFADYNTSARDGDMSRFEMGYSFMDEGQKAENCISCGECVKRCPQKINIPAKMAGIIEREEPSRLAKR